MTLFTTGRACSFPSFYIFYVPFYAFLNLPDLYFWWRLLL